MNTGGRGRNWHPNNRGFPMRGSRGYRGNNRGSWREGNNFRGGRSYQNQGDRRGRNDYRSQQRYQKPDLPTKRLSEKDIGVTEYVSKNEGFSGIIKFRYSDFQVSEINLNGEVAQLTTLDPPEPPQEEQEVEDDDTIFSKYNPEILPLETWDKINALVVTPKPTTVKVEIDVTGMSKEDRTKIHDAVKKVFSERIVGRTVSIGEKKFVTFERYRKGIRVDKRIKWVWPHEYLYFIVHKENCDTMDAAQRIAQRLRIHAKTSLMGYAGTKDRRAKTSQWFSVRKFNPKKVAEFCRNLDGVHIGNFSFAPEPLKLGMLKGNRFRIALRNITAPDSTIEESCTSLKERGYINYYGLQRFGTNVTVPTYEIGMKLLKQDFQGALDCILASRSNNRDRPENNVQYALERNPNDIHGALNQIPRNVRLLYLHSYQSLIWNKCVSERIKRFGLKLEVGDLVPEDKNAIVSDNIDESDNESDSEQDSLQKEEESQTKATNQDSDNTTNLKTESVTKNKTMKEERRERLKVKVLTQEDIDSGNYSIFDLVLPLPGSDIEYPSNMKEYYEELMSKDGLTLQLRNKIRNYSMGGTYRHVIARVSDMKWSILKYSNGMVDLIRSDLDMIQNKPEFVSEPDGKYRALILDISLQSSSYATMALRELMKIDTACDFQAAQNNYHKTPQNNAKVDSEKNEANKKNETNKNNETHENNETNKNNEINENNKTSENNEETEVNEMQCDDKASENGAEKRKLSVSEDESVKKAKQDE